MWSMGIAVPCGVPGGSVSTGIAPALKAHTAESSARENAARPSTSTSVPTIRMNRSSAGNISQRTAQTVVGFFALPDGRDLILRHETDVYATVARAPRGAVVRDHGALGARPGGERPRLETRVDRAELAGHA